MTTISQINEKAPGDRKVTAKQRELVTESNRQGALTDPLVLNDVQNTKGQAVTDATAFDLFTIPIAVGEGVCVNVTVVGFASDGTDHQLTSQQVHVRAVNKAGTVTAVVVDKTTVDTNEASSSGTLTVAIAAAEGTANLLDVSVVVSGSLTETTLEIDWKAEVLRGGSITKVNADA